MPVRLSNIAGATFRSAMLCLVLISSTFGCTPVNRHAVLDFVFDGVPPYRTPEERALDAAATAQREAAAEAEIRGAQRKRRRLKKLARFTHGPFAAKECTRCHDLTKASGFRGLAGGAGGARSATDLAEAGRLRMPVDELCVHCHTDFSDSDEAPGNDGRWIHGPVASGWCVLCHEPHSSRYPSLLALAPPARLCGRCHLREELIKTAEHRPLGIEDSYPEPPKVNVGKETEATDRAPAKDSIVRVARNCTKCHDPHMGPDRLLLRPRDQWETTPAAAVERVQRDMSRKADP